MSTPTVTITKLMDKIPEHTPIGTAIAQLNVQLDGQETDLEAHLNQYARVYLSSFSGYDDQPTHVFSIVGDKIVTASEMNYEAFGSRDFFYLFYVDIGEKYYTQELSFRIQDVVDTVKGTASADVLAGGRGMDKILGMSGNDRLGGYAGDDTLYGGLGKDSLAGGSGEDTFLYKSIKESTVKDFDTIIGWDHTGKHTTMDTIDLSQIDANTKMAGNQDFAWLGAKEFTGHAGELRYERGAHSTMVYADVNGDGNADMAIRINDSVKMFAGDFIL